MHIEIGVWRLQVQKQVTAPESSYDQHHVKTKPMCRFSGSHLSPSGRLIYFSCPRGVWNCSRSPLVHTALSLSLRLQWSKSWMSNLELKRTNIVKWYVLLLPIQTYYKRMNADLQKSRLKRYFLVLPMHAYHKPWLFTPRKTKHVNWYRLGLPVQQYR